MGVSNLVSFPLGPRLRRRPVSRRKVRNSAMSSNSYSLWELNAPGRSPPNASWGCGMRPLCHLPREEGLSVGQLKGVHTAGAS